MHKKLLSLLIALVLATGAWAAAVATAAKIIRVDVAGPDKFQVEGKAVTAATLSAAIASLVQDKEHTVVEIKLTGGTDRALVDKVKEAGRKAGIYLFSVAGQPAEKG